MTQRYSSWMTTTALSASGADHGNEIMENYFDISPTMKAIKKYGGVQYRNTGGKFTWPIEKAGGTFQWMGRTTKFSDNTPDPYCTAEWKMKFGQLPVKVYRQDEIENRESKTKIFDFVKGLQENAKNSAEDEFDTMLWRAVPADNSPNSIPELVDSTGTYGGIAYDDHEDSKGNNLWAATETAMGSFASNGLSYMNTMLIALHVKKAKTDAIFMPEDSYGYFLDVVEDKHFLTNESSKMGFGIGKVPYMGHPIEVGPNVPDGTIYYLDFRSIKVRWNKGATEMSQWIQMENEDARKAHYHYCLSVFITSRRKQGKHTGVTA